MPFSERNAESEAAIVADFKDFTRTQNSRRDLISEVLGQGIEDLRDLNTLNDRLSNSGRHDLEVTESAVMMPVYHPYDIADRCNNFTPNFRMCSGWEDTGELDCMDRPVIKGVSATADDLEAAKKMPKIHSYEDIKLLRGKFPILRSSHATKPAFLRMLNLFPDFTKELVLGISDPNNGYHYDRFEPELYVAYQFMSRLVDANDMYVRNEDSNADVDNWYLCR